MPCVGAVILETLQRSNDRVQQSPLRAVSDTSEFLRLKDAAVVDPVGLGSHARGRGGDRFLLACDLNIGDGAITLGFPQVLDRHATHII
jgi:hypothetical protein